MARAENGPQRRGFRPPVFQKRFVFQRCHQEAMPGGPITTNASGIVFVERWTRSLRSFELSKLAHCLINQCEVTYINHIGANGGQ